MSNNVPLYFFNQWLSLGNDRKNGHRRLSPVSIFLSFHCEAFCLQVLVVPSAFRGKLQDAVIRIGHAFLVEDAVPFPPDHVLGCLVREHLHGALEHHALIADQSLVIEINTGFRVILVLPHPHGGGIGGEPELLQAIPLPGLQHGLDIWKTVIVHGADETHILFSDKALNFFQIHFLRSFQRSIRSPAAEAVRKSWF